MSYSSQFKNDVILKYLEGRSTQKQIAEEYGIGKNTLNIWINKYLKSHPEIEESNYICGLHRSPKFKEKVILEYLENGVTQEEIAQKYDISITTVSLWLLKYSKAHPEIEVSNYKYGSKYSPKFKEKVILEYLEGNISLVDLSKKNGISIFSIKEWLKKYVKIHPETKMPQRVLGSKLKYCPEFKEKAVLEYLQGDSTRKQIADKYNISSTSLTNWCFEYVKVHPEIKLPNNKFGSKYSTEFKDKVVLEYIEGNISQMDLSKKYHISCSTLQDWLNKYLKSHPKAKKPQRFGGRKAKHSYEFKEKVILEYLEGRSTKKQITEKYGIITKTLNVWLDKYLKVHPEIELPNNKYGLKYSAEFKEKVIFEYFEGNISQVELSKKYYISFRTLQNWLNKYLKAHPDVKKLQRVRGKNRNTPLICKNKS